jgi:Na+/melibiose symporter-like transporter
MAAALCCFQ